MRCLLPARVRSWLLVAKSAVVRPTRLLCLRTPQRSPPWRAAGVVLSVGLLGAAPPDYEQVRAGDAAWDDKERRTAREHWEKAAASPHPAVAAMAELRLLQISGTSGLITHGIRIEKQRLRCPVKEPWCLLAEVDRQFFLGRVGMPHERQLGLSYLAQLEQSPSLSNDPLLRAAVEQRRAWIGTAEEPGTPPKTGPGTWTIGISPLGATGLGGGAAMNIYHPDVGLRGGRLSVGVGATNRGTLRGSFSYNAPGRVWWHTGVRAARYERVVLSTESRSSTESWGTLTAEVGPGLRKQWGAFWLGPALLRDAGETTTPQTGVGLELWARARWGPTRSSLRLLAAAGNYQIATGTGHVTLMSPTSRSLVRLSVAPTVASPEAPVWRIPGWGGGVVLKHGSWESLRHPVLSGISGEVRSPKLGRFQGAVYGEGALGDRPVAGAGAALMVGLPPSPQNALRLDVAWGSLGLGISTGWSRSF